MGNIINISMREINSYRNNQDYVIVDLRTRNEFERRHIEGAVNIPFEYLNMGMRKLDRDKTYIFYCSHGNLSIIATRRLIKNNYKAINTIGGFEAGKNL